MVMLVGFSPNTNLSMYVSLFSFGLIVLTIYLFISLVTQAIMSLCNYCFGS